MRQAFEILAMQRYNCIMTPAAITPLSNQLISKLACPTTMQSLALADERLLHEVNSAIAKGNLRNQKGQLLTETLSALLVRADRKVAYPVVCGIPVVIAEEALSIL